MELANNPAAPVKRAQAVRELALGIAATLTFFFPVLLTPIMGVFASVFTPLPTLLAFYRLGSPLGFVVPAGATAIAWAVLYALKASQGIVYFIEMILLGLLLAAGMRRRLSVEKTVAGASLIIFLLSAFTFWHFQGGSGAEIIKSLEADLKASVSAVMEQHGSLSQDKELLGHTVDTLIPIAVRLLPGVALASTLVVAWLNVWLAMRFFRVHSVPLPDWIGWSQWKSPEPIVWIVIVGGFMLLAPPVSAKIVAMNGLIAIGVVYLFQGLAVTGYYFERWKLPKLVRAFFYGLLLLQQFVTLGVVLLGFFDVWFDFRRLSIRSAPGV